MEEKHLEIKVAIQIQKSSNEIFEVRGGRIFWLA